MRMTSLSLRTPERRGGLWYHWITRRDSVIYLGSRFVPSQSWIHRRRANNADTGGGAYKIENAVARPTNTSATEADSVMSML